MDQPTKHLRRASASIDAARKGGSLTRRMIGIASIWIVVLLAIGGFALDRVLSQAFTRNFDARLEYVLSAMIVSAELDPDGEVRFIRQPADQRFLEPYSGFYWQVSGGGREPFRSRSLWDRALPVGEPHNDFEIHSYNEDEWIEGPLRILERDAILPESDTPFRFQVASSRAVLDEQIAELRRTLVRSFALLGLGLIALAALQATYGLWPLRRVREAITDVRTGRQARVDETLPREIEPLVVELNNLLDHNERQAEEARRHAGNLAHALKTPLTVIQNEAEAQDADLPDTVIREARVMRRQVDHHLARARAVGRRGAGQSRSPVWQALQSVERAVRHLHDDVTIDIAGAQDAIVAVERQDLDELLGNLMENAAKYGGGRVFVTVEKRARQAESVPDFVDILIEDDGPGIPEAERDAIFGRGARLDTNQPGTGLGLAIVSDVAEIYGGAVALEESEDLGGLLVRLSLPAAESAPPEIV
ncbi:HAMP domain-containing sensor histidine kinase [Parasphingopyxis sp.]|uniref:ATP-binding protein n=1 Tax=Parasphingopyxis sp. TaxID=1920299 RepID=UPI0026370625|nr:HAMP domain-containing sensor histidine kinase [Parasphingopyxis sp.]